MLFSLLKQNVSAQRYFHNVRKKRTNVLLINKNYRDVLQKLYRTESNAAGLQRQSDNVNVQYTLRRQ